MLAWMDFDAPWVGSKRLYHNDLCCVFVDLMVESYRTDLKVLEQLHADTCHRSWCGSPRHDHYGLHDLHDRDL